MGFAAAAECPAGITGTQYRMGQPDIKGCTLLFELLLKLFICFDKQKHAGTGKFFQSFPQIFDPGHRRKKMIVKKKSRWNPAPVKDDFMR